MKQYCDVLRRILDQGTWQNNRTGVRTLFVPGANLVFDMADGFPLLTTKKMPMRSIAAELCGFLRGYDSAAGFRELGTKIWDANANENKAWLNNPNRAGTDDLGRVYGVQWRRWRKHVPGPEYSMEDHEVDQLANAVHDLQHNPESRRIIVNAWNPGELDRMALPPCHLLFQFLVQQEGRRLHVVMYQRSCDMFLGVPFNIASYALLLHLVARATGYEPGAVTMQLADAHIYENHLPQVRLQLEREPRQLPHLLIRRWRVDDALAALEAVQPEDVEVVGYEPHPAIAAPMAV